MDGQIPLESSDVADIIVAMSEHNKHCYFFDSCSYVCYFSVSMIIKEIYTHPMYSYVTEHSLLNFNQHHWEVG